MIQEIEGNMQNFLKTFKDTLQIIESSENLIITDEFFKN